MNRQEAKALGCKRYQGSPCKHGHSGERHTSNGACVVCHTEKQKVSRKRWKQRNSERSREYSRKWRRANPERSREHSRKWKRANRESNYSTVKEWRENNRDKYNDWSKKWRGRPETKVSIALRNTLRRMALAGLKGLDEISSQDVGYRPSDLVSHIEGLWEDGMSWENYGDWHIDHIKPVAAFVREGVTDPSVVNALDNLQPLWAEENFKKGASTCH